jgi:hypothetical protein
MVIGFYISFFLSRCEEETFGLMRLLETIGLNFEEQ